MKSLRRVGKIRRSGEKRSGEKMKELETVIRYNRFLINVLSVGMDNTDCDIDKIFAYLRENQGSL